MRAPTTVRVGVVIAATALMLVGIAGCGAPARISPGDVEQQIADSLATSVGGDFGVSCPADIPAQQGYQFTCTVEDRTAASTVTVTVTEDDDQGAYSWRVAPMPSGSPSPAG